MANCLSCIIVASALGLFIGGLAAVLQLMSIPDRSSYSAGRLMVDATRHGAFFSAVLLTLLGISGSALAFVAN